MCINKLLNILCAKIIAANRLHASIALCNLAKRKDNNQQTNPTPFLLFLSGKYY